MTKLYDTQPYLQHFTAEIISILEKDASFHIVLNETAFYPVGGGQPCDTGMIEDSPIEDVYEKDGIVYHVTKKKPIKIHKVHCSIDWPRRLYHMQHHLAQHLLSALFVQDYNATTLSFHVGSDLCTLDIDQQLDQVALASIFDKATTCIRECIPVTSFYPTKQELKKLKLKKLPGKATDAIRLVQIGDVSIDACCGIHPQNTLELMHCMYLKSESYKGGLRISFVAGFRAIDAIVAKESLAKEALVEATSKSHKLSSELTSLNHTVEAYEVHALLQATPLTGNYRIIQEVYDNKSTKSLQRFATKLVAEPNVIALLGLKVDGMAYLVFMCSSNLKELHMSRLLQESIIFIDGRGGGTPTSAQGGGKSVANMDSALLYADKKLKEALGI